MSSDIITSILVYIHYILVLKLCGALPPPPGINVWLRACPLPIVSSIYSDAAFTVAAPKYWNSLPDELPTLSYFITFKCRLYSYMLSL